MAKVANETEVSVEESTEGKRKRKASGPRQSKPVHILFRVVDANGNAIQGATLEVITATKDTDAFMDALDQNRDAARVRVNV